MYCKDCKYRSDNGECSIMKSKGTKYSIVYTDINLTYLGVYIVGDLFGCIHFIQK